MVRGWLARGVDGFRLDVFNVVPQAPEHLPSNPRRRSVVVRTSVRSISTTSDQPDLLDLLAEFRALVDELSGTDDASASCSSADYRGGRPARSASPSGLRLPAHQPAVEGRCLRVGQRRPRGALRPEGRWPTVVLSNHDQSRHVTSTVTKDRDADGDAIARAAAVLVLTLRGTPFLYYGEEIAHGDVHVPWAESIDPPAKRGGRRFGPSSRGGIVTRHGSPMPWARRSRRWVHRPDDPWLRIGGRRDRGTSPLRLPRPDRSSPAIAG